MNTYDYIPHSLLAFFQWLITFYTHLVTMELDIPETPKVALMEKITLFRVLYEKTTDPATARPVDIHARNAARKELEVELREFVKAYIRYNPEISDAQREELGISVPSGERHPAPVPATQPVLKVDASIDSQLSIDFHDAEKTGKGKPEGVHGLELKWVIADALPASYDEFTHSSFDTHTPVILKFDLNQQGARVYLVARWENTRGEKGPWGKPVSAVIP